MNLTKSYEFFKPETVKDRIHIVGCGSVGSALAIQLVRTGLTKITLWDMDVVDEHNLVNQQYRRKDIGQPKVHALKDILLEINPDLEDGGLKLKPEGWHGEKLSGYVFLAVDSIEIRQQIVDQQFNDLSIKAMFDIRTLLTGAQHFAADWKDMQMKKDFRASMEFSHEEAKEETPTSACGVTLGVVPTVLAICALAVANFIQFAKGNGIKRTMILDVFQASLMAFD